MSISTYWKDTSHDLGEISYVYQLEKYKLQFNPSHCWLTRCASANMSIYPSSGNNIKCYNWISWSLRVSNQSSVLTSKLWSFLDAYHQPAWIDIIRRAGADINWCTPASWLNRLRLSLDLQVLVLPIPLLSWTAVTTYTSSMRSFRNLITTYRKNLNMDLTCQISFRRTFGVKCMDLAIMMSNKSLVAPPTHWSWYGKSLSAGSCEVLYIDLAIIVIFFTCHCWSMTTRKKQVYKNDTRCTKYIRKYEIDGRYPSQYGFCKRGKNWQLARDLSPWCGASGSLH